MTPLARVLLGAGTAVAGERLLAAAPQGGQDRWQRHNHRGRTVTLLSGPALAVAATVSARVPPRAAVVAGLVPAAAGVWDDVAGDGSKGLRGHGRALREGRFTTGAAKVVIIGAAGLLAVGLLDEDRRPVGVLLGGGVVAGTANLLNLLDLRPGRALKVGLAIALALGEVGPAAAAAALLPGDLGERTMLGDAGANALGGVLGLALAGRLRTAPARAAAVAVLMALTLASERTSFSAVIDTTPPLRWLDGLGRLP